MLNEAEFFVEQLHKEVRGHKVTWWFVFDGKRIDFTDAKLHSQRQFRRTVFRAVQKLPPRRAPVNFDRWLNRLIENSVENETADPVGKGRRS